MPLRRKTVCRVAVVAALASAATGATSASAAAPDFVGITADETFQQPGEFRQTNLAAMRRAGVGLIRQVFDWSTIETSAGVYDLTFLDQYVLDAAQAGIRIMPVLTNAPEFYERRGSQRGARRPRDEQTMATWAATLVRRYGPTGTLWEEHPDVRKLPIRVWEPWNEPSLAVYWGPRPNAREYVRMLRIVGRAIEREDPGAEIVTAGLPNSQLSSAVPLTRYLRSLYRAGGARYFDTLAINAYARDARELEQLLRQVREVMNDNRDRRTRIWITELGWGDRGPRHRFIVGARGQARRITTSFAAVRRLRGSLRLRGLVYFSWRDGRPYAPLFQDLWGLHTGLLRVDGSRKPAHGAFVRAARGLR
jgi:hypothetical protein